MYEAISSAMNYAEDCCKFIEDLDVSDFVSADKSSKYVITEFRQTEDTLREIQNHFLKLLKKDYPEFILKSRPNFQSSEIENLKQIFTIYVNYMFSVLISFEKKIYQKGWKIPYFVPVSYQNGLIGSYFNDLCDCNKMGKSKYDCNYCNVHQCFKDFHESKSINSFTSIISDLSSVLPSPEEITPPPPPPPSPPLPPRKQYRAQRPKYTLLTEKNHTTSIAPASYSKPTSRTYPPKSKARIIID